MNSSDIARKRSVLFSARIRFSPEVQPVRDTAIDKIMEQNLLVADCEGGLTLKKIEQQGTVCFAGGTPAITRHDMEVSLKRLAECNRVIVSVKLNQNKYRLSEEAREELWEMQRLTETRFSRVVGKLFKDAEEEPSSYATPFLECLCLIFSWLGEAYVRLIKGEVGLDELLRLPNVSRALQDIKKKYLGINESLFETAVFSFFRDSDPDYVAIKWNMAQNHYIAKALGLDPSGYLLSKEVFGNAVLYLDTNVIIQALEPKARHYGSFNALSKACQKLQIQLKVCQISLNELQRAVDYYGEIIQKVANQIPRETTKKVSGVFYQLYREQLSSSGKIDFSELFASFLQPMGELAQSYGVTLVDDLWFGEAEHQKETEDLLKAIKLEYQAKCGRPKYSGSALHDALLLRWIQLERERSAKNTWLITLDTSLPGFLPQSMAVPTRPLAITLDALLQWISPIAIHDDIEDEVAAIFSEAVKYQLLPQESFFDLRDFLVFAEMEWSCKELPAEDVEQCIRYLKTNAPNLDPSVPTDREKIAREVTKFFADPGRKYKQEIQRLEAERLRIEQEHKRRLEENAQAIKERDEKIEELKKQQIEQEERRQYARLKKSAQFRISIIILIFFAYEFTVVYLAWQHGQGGNLFQKVLNSWPFLSLGCAIGIILFWFVLGRERIRILGWPFTKCLKNG
jgi:hypothetical protein